MIDVLPEEPAVKGEPDEGPFAMAFDEALERHGDALLLDVDPRSLTDQIRYSIDVAGKPFMPADYFLAGGDWQSWSVPVAGLRVAEEARQLIEARLDHRLTRSYRHRLRALAAGRVARQQHTDLASEEQIEAYYADFARMIAAARRYGILARPTARLDDDAGLHHASAIRSHWQELSERNIGVGIGADGRLWRVGPGKHRLAVAHALDLARVPAEVRLIHPDWLRHFEQAGATRDDAIRACLADVRKRQAQVIATVEEHQGEAASRLLHQASRAQPQGEGFFLPFEDLPAEAGRALLTTVSPARIHARIDAPDGFLLGRGPWTRRLSPVAKTDLVPTHGVAPSYSVLKTPPVPLALGPEGEVFLNGAGAVMPQGPALAEVRLIHAKVLRRLVQAEGLSYWQALCRAVQSVSNPGDLS